MSALTTTAVARTNNIDGLVEAHVVAVDGFYRALRRGSGDDVSRAIDEVGRIEDLMRDHARRVLSDDGDTTESAVPSVASDGVAEASVPVSEGAGIVDLHRGHSVAFGKVVDALVCNDRSAFGVALGEFERVQDAMDAFGRTHQAKDARAYELFVSYQRAWRGVVDALREGGDINAKLKSVLRASEVLKSCLSGQSRVGAPKRVCKAVSDLALVKRRPVAKKFGVVKSSMAYAGVGRRTGTTKRSAKRGAKTGADEAGVLRTVAPTQAEVAYWKAHLSEAKMSVQEALQCVNRMGPIACAARTRVMERTDDEYLAKEMSEWIKAPSLAVFRASRNYEHHANLCCAAIADFEADQSKWPLFTFETMLNRSRRLREELEHAKQLFAQAEAVTAASCSRHCVGF